MPVHFIPRTTWIDSAIFGLPHATAYDAGTDTCDVGNTDGISIYYEHETGVNQVKGGVLLLLQLIFYQVILILLKIKNKELLLEEMENL